MAKIRVQDVAKELNVPVQEIMKKLEGLGIFVPNPMSTLQPAEYVQIKSLITGKKIQMVKKKVAKEAPEAVQTAPKAAAAPAEPKQDAPKAAAPKVEEPKKEAPKVEAPKAEPVKEAPKAEPVKEAPKTEAPKAEPVKETPKAEAPKAEPVKEAPKAAASGSSALFDDAMLAQLNTVFSRMANPLVLKLTLNDSPVSSELRGYMEELARHTDKLTVEVDNLGEDAPCVRIFRADGTWSGLAFHGVPGGHEFTSFVLGLYNAAGPGQALDADVKQGIQALGKKDIKVLVSLSCTMCPELVTAAQRIAAKNPGVTAEVYDLNHFPTLRDKYNVMSVPCLVINDGQKVTFGKKNIRQLLELIR